MVNISINNIIKLNNKIKMLIEVSFQDYFIDISEKINVKHD